jgi:hypothetical protein
MTLSRRVFLTATGVVALARPTADFALAPPLNRPMQPVALLMMGHHHDPALCAGLGLAPDATARRLIEKPSGDDLYGWIQTQCDQLPGYRLAAMTDEVGALMLSLALRDRAARIVVEGHHLPMPGQSAMTTHNLTFFGDMEERAKLGSSLRHEGWSRSHSMDPVPSTLVAASHHHDWAFDFGKALAAAYTPPAPQPARAAWNSEGMHPREHGQASRSILADI